MAAHTYLYFRMDYSAGEGAYFLNICGAVTVGGCDPGQAVCQSTGTAVLAEDRILILNADKSMSCGTLESMSISSLGTNFHC